MAKQKKLSEQILNANEIVTTIKTNADLSVVASKGKAGKKGASKLVEARSILGDKFNAIPLISEKGRKTKETFSWKDMFNSAQASQVHHDAMKAAQTEYKAKSASISQQMLSMSRVAGRSVEKFDEYYKAMIVVYKAESNKKVPQSIYDAASIVRRAYARKINPNKFGSVETIKKAITEHDKALVKENESAVVEDTTLKSAIHDLAKIGNLLLAVDKKLSDQFIKDMNNLRDNYATHITDTNSETKQKTA